MIRKKNIINNSLNIKTWIIRFYVCKYDMLYVPKYIINSLITILLMFWSMRILL